MLGKYYYDFLKHVNILLAFGGGFSMLLNFPMLCVLCVRKRCSRIGLIVWAAATAVRVHGIVWNGHHNLALTSCTRSAASCVVRAQKAARRRMTSAK